MQQECQQLLTRKQSLLLTYVYLHPFVLFRVAQNVDHCHRFIRNSRSVLKTWRNADPMDWVRLQVVPNVLESGAGYPKSTNSNLNLKNPTSASLRISPKQPSCSKTSCAAFGAPATKTSPKCFGPQTHRVNQPLQVGHGKPEGNACAASRPSISSTFFQAASLRSISALSKQARINSDTSPASSSALHCATVKSLRLNLKISSFTGWCSGAQQSFEDFGQVQAAGKGSPSDVLNAHPSCW